MFFCFFLDLVLCILLIFLIIFELKLWELITNLFKLLLYIWDIFNFVCFLQWYDGKNDAFCSSLVWYYGEERHIFSFSLIIWCEIMSIILKHTLMCCCMMTNFLVRSTVLSWTNDIIVFPLLLYNLTNKNFWFTL